LIESLRVEQFVECVFLLAAFFEWSLRYHWAASALALVLLIDLLEFIIGGILFQKLHIKRYLLWEATSVKGRLQNRRQVVIVMNALLPCEIEIEILLHAICHCSGSTMFFAIFDTIFDFVFLITYIIFHNYCGIFKVGLCYDLFGLPFLNILLEFGVSLSPNLLNFMGIFLQSFLQTFFFLLTDAFHPRF